MPTRCFVTVEMSDRYSLERKGVFDITVNAILVYSQEETVPD